MRLAQRSEIQSKESHNSRVSKSPAAGATCVCDCPFPLPSLVARPVLETKAALGHATEMGSASKVASRRLLADAITALRGAKVRALACWKGDVVVGAGRREHQLAVAREGSCLYLQCVLYRRVLACFYLC